MAPAAGARQAAGGMRQAAGRIGLGRVAAITNSVAVDCGGGCPVLPRHKEQNRMHDRISPAQ